MTESEQRQALIETSFYRAAECLGDITPNVVELYYQRFPAARERFEALSCDNRRQLEGEMVEQTVYCMLQYHEAPTEIDIVFFSTLPHHVETLQIPLRFFTGFLDCVTDVVKATIPPDHHDELSAMEELSAKLHAPIDTASRWLNPAYVPV